MKEIRANVSQEQAAIQLMPIISYPRVAEAGETYLLTIDVRLADGSPWPYQEEEFEISFVLETAPFFTHEPLGEHEPGIVLHRFGGTYGAAEYLLTASKQEVSAGHIKIALLNGWGLPVAQIPLECEVKQNASKLAGKSKIVKKRKQTPFGGPAPSGGTSPFTGTAPSSGTSPFTGPAPLIVTPPRLAGQENLSSAAYDVIEKQLTQTGWEVLVSSNLELLPGGLEPMIPDGNIAIKAFPGFESDYLLFINRERIGLVSVHTEPQSESTMLLLGTVERGDYLELADGLEYIYATNGYVTQFKSYLEPGMPIREVYTFHQPATLALWLKQAPTRTSFRARLGTMPPLTQGGLYDEQFIALQQIEKSLSTYHSHTLVQMQTGMGKTRIAINSIYRLLSWAQARHILYIVDSSFARQYALEAFQSFIMPETGQKLTDRYKVSLIGTEKLDPSVHVYIGFIEELYGLYAEGWEGQRLPIPYSAAEPEQAVRYRRDYAATMPIEYFDVIFLPECEHVNYTTWQNVLNYFDAFFVGIASEVSDEVLGFFFFKHNLVYPEKKAEDSPEVKRGADASIKKQGDPSSVVRGIISGVRTLLRKDTGLSHENDRLLLLIWLLFLEYLDDFEEMQEELLGGYYVPIIEKNYRWRDWVVSEDPAQQRTGDELLKFVNIELIPYLRRLGNSDYRDMHTIVSTIFRQVRDNISSGYILREVVNQLNTINFNSSNDIHTMSALYETMLKSIHDSAGDVGEFYTPRPIVRFIIDRLQPQLGESILDPACGTAGFLVETYKLLKDQVRTPEQRRQLQDNLRGIEKKSTPYLLAVMNMLIHGINEPDLLKGNALASVNLDNVSDRGRVDIIVSNPPFGGKEESDIFNNFPKGMRTAETSLLFFQYIMAHLKRSGGRCGVVLPNGFLFGNGIAARIKEKLLTEFNLHTIVRLPVGTFAPYTSIPTNILFFTADEGLYNREKDPSTKEIWYYEIPLPEGRKSFSRTKPIQDKDFQACRVWWERREEDEHAWKVSIEQIRDVDYNLDYKNPHRGSLDKSETGESAYSEETNMLDAHQWRALLAQICQDPQEKQRIIQTLNINSVTLQRWIITDARPRRHKLLRLVQALPRYRDELVPLLQEEFGDFTFDETELDEFALQKEQE